MFKARIPLMLSWFAAAAAAAIIHMLHSAMMTQSGVGATGATYSRSTAANQTIWGKFPCFVTVLLNHNSEVETQVSRKSFVRKKRGPGGGSGELDRASCCPTLSRNVGKIKSNQVLDDRA